MGIYESTLRSQGNIDQLASVVQDMYRKKKMDENALRLRSSMTKQVRPQTVQQQVSSNTGVPETPGGDLINEPKTLSEMNAGDIGNISDILRQSPELGNEVNLMNQSAQARQPSMFSLNQGEGRYQYNPMSKKVEMIAQNPHIFPPTKIDKMQLIRNGQQVYDEFRPGDVFYEKPKEEGNVLLGTQNVDENGIKKKVDLYGTIDKSGRKIVKEKKYQDFTPAKGERTKQEIELKTDQARIKQLTDANEGISKDYALMQMAKDKKGNPLYSPDVIQKVKDNIEQNQDEIARLHLAHDSKWITLKVAREYYRSLDMNAPELKLDDKTLKEELEKNGYQIGGPVAEENK